MVQFVVGALLDFYVIVLLARMILSWVQVYNPRWTPHGPLLVVANVVYTLTDPPLRWLSKVARPVDFGGLRLDVAYLLLFLLVAFVQYLNARFMPF